METNVSGRLTPELPPAMCLKQMSVDHQMQHLDDLAGKGCMPPPPFVGVHSGSVEPSISAEACRSQLGERSFNVLRQAMLQQQEVFIEQLWDLHRLTRAQGRKAALLQSEPRFIQEPVDAVGDVLSRQRQEQVRSQTMHEISQLPTIPGSLRRSFTSNPPPRAEKHQDARYAPPSATSGSRLVPSGMPARDLAHAPSPSANTSPQRMAGPYGGHVFAAPFNGALAYPQAHIPGATQPGFAFGDGSNGGQYAWAPNAPMGSSAFSAQAAIPSLQGRASMGSAPNHPYITGLSQQGNLIGVCNPGYTGVQQLRAQQQEGDHQSAGQGGGSAEKQPVQAQMSPVDVSSLLNMMAPGMPGAPTDMHAQWFAKNCGSAVPLSAAGVSSDLLGLHPNMMEVPGMTEPKAAPPEAAPSHNSNSVWSGNTLFVPAGLQLSGVAHQQGMPSRVMHGPEAKGFAGLPSAASMMPPEMPPCNVAAATASHQSGSAQEQVPDSQPKAGACHTDESAATILMSLKGS